MLLVASGAVAVPFLAALLVFVSALRTVALKHLLFFKRLEYVGGFHGAASFLAEEARNQESLLHGEQVAVLAHPVTLGQRFYSVAVLMYWDVAASAEHDLVIVFVVSTVADAALSVLGSREHLPLLLLLVSIQKLPVVPLPTHHCFLFHLSLDFSVFKIIFFELFFFNVFEKFFLLSRRIPNIQQNLIGVLLVPLHIFEDVLHLSVI